MAKLKDANHRLQRVTIGPQALRQLGALITVLKGNNLLAPVTVVVPHPLAGLAIRRSLATTEGGVVNVRFDILARIADAVAAPAFASEGLRPLNNTIMAAAVRHVLHENPGTVLEEVASHPATQSELSRFVTTYSSLDDPARQRFAVHSEKNADLVRVAERVQARLANYYNRYQSLEQAAATITAQPHQDHGLGNVIAYLPAPLGPAESVLFEALASAGRLWVIAGETGDHQADTVLEQVLAPLEHFLGKAYSVRGTPANAVENRNHHGPPLTVVDVSDPDEEVRAALREVVKHWHGGTPLERMAVLYPSADPYAALLYDQANSAEIQIAGAAVSSLRASVAGAVLLGALRLNPAHLERHAVMTWLHSAPIVNTAGQAIPVAEWDLTSRKLGIVAAPIPKWVQRLHNLNNSSGHPPEAVSFPTFLEVLADHLTKVRQSRSWAEFTNASHRLLEAFLGKAAVREQNQWPELQLQAYELVEEALATLTTLDEIEPNPSLSVFINALESELDTEYGRLANFGDGLLVAPIQHGIGLDLDFVAVVGLAEGTVPSRNVRSVFLNDDALENTTLGLPTDAEITAKQHYLFLNAIASAGSALLTTPRGDLRDKRTKLPSRWLLKLMSERLGSRVTSETFNSVVPAPDSGLQFHSVASFSAGLSQASYHVSQLERDLAELASWVDVHHSIDDFPYLDSSYPHLVKAVQARVARGASFNEYTGMVHPPETLLNQAMSATALENWAVCPRRYFFAHVLHLKDEELPEEIEEISAADRGSLVHKTLEQFFQEVIDTGSKAPHQVWSDIEHERLQQIFDELADAAEQHGLTGYPALWQLTRASILTDLHQFLRFDDEQRARFRSTPIAAELRFGYRDIPALEVDFPNGKTVRFTGSADRVDICEDGRVIVVDYKTGSYTPFKELSVENPVAAGTKLQLPVYALAAAQKVSSLDTSSVDTGSTREGAVRSEYWFISKKGGFRSNGYELTPEVFSRFYQAVTSITDGIGQGVFPGVPDPLGRPDGDHTNCAYCNFDRLCRLDRSEEWTRVRLDPAVAPFVSLSEIAEVEEPDGESQ